MHWPQPIEELCKPSLKYGAHTLAKTGQAQIEQAIDDIEARIYRIAKDKDIKSSRIGEIAMDKIRKVDKIAYIRFASVYREFADLDDFKKELKELR